jgi:hypothetical protein
MAGHALEWKLIMDVLQISFSDILIDVLDVSSKWLPQSTLWFGRHKRRFHCWHDHCTSENGFRRLSFDFQEMAEHLQQHHMQQHSGHGSTDAGIQLNFLSDPATAPDTTITVEPRISQQDQDRSQSITHPPNQIDGSTLIETHVLDICFPIPDSLVLHHLDELELEHEWKVPVLLGQLKMKFQNKKSPTRLLSWRLFHLKRLQRVKINKVSEKRVGSNSSG